jgi:coniferyl-aldehyde dehydrogenase
MQARMNTDTNGHASTNNQDVAMALRAALQRTRTATRLRGTPTCETRLAWLETLEKMLLRRKEDIAKAISQDFGNRSRVESYVSEVVVTVEGIRHTRAHLKEWMLTRKADVSWLFQPGRAETIPQPLGVIGIIAPWNYPVQLACAPLVDALAAGNGAMIKPSELVPATGELLRQMIAECFDADHVSVHLGGTDVGEAFARLPFDHLLFTGSTRVGKLVMRAAAENLVPVTLELGGKSPVIVSRDVNLSTAATRVMSGKLFNSGQTCIAPDYVFVPAEKRDEFAASCQRAVGDLYPSVIANPDYTTIVNDTHYQRIQSYLDDARSKGAKVIVVNPAGEPEAKTSRKMFPHLVLDATDDMLVMQEEIFGPVFPVRTYNAIDEAIEYINDHPRPLALYYFGNDKVETARVLHETISGGVTINDVMLHIAQHDMPFGGVGASGMGAYHGKTGFDAMSQRKPVFYQSAVNSTGLLRPPFGRMMDMVLKVLLND